MPLPSIADPTRLAPRRALPIRSLAAGLGYMLGHEIRRRGAGRLADFDEFEVALPCKLRKQRIGDRIGRQAGTLIGDGAGSGRIERIAEFAVDRLEQCSDAWSSTYDHDPTDVGRAPDDPLAYPHELHDSACVHTELSRTVLALDLTHLRIDAERAQRAREPIRERGEAGTDPGPRIPGRNGPGKGQRSVLEHRGPASCQTQHGLEALFLRERSGPRKTWAGPVEHREGQRIQGPIEPQRFGRVPGIDGAQQGMRQRRIRQRRVPHLTPMYAKAVHPFSLALGPSALPARCGSSSHVPGGPPNRIEPRTIYCRMSQSPDPPLHAAVHDPRSARGSERPIHRRGYHRPRSTGDAGHGSTGGNLVSACRQNRLRLAHRGQGHRRRVRATLALLIVSFASGWDRPAHAQGEATLSMNFHKAELSDIIDRIAPQLGAQFLYDAQLSGRVTIALPRKVTRDEAWQLLHAALGMKGFGAFPMPGGGFKVVALATAGGQSVLSLDPPSPVGEARLLTLVSLDAISGPELIAVIRPLLDSTTIAVSAPAANAVILATTERRLAALTVLIQELDERGRQQVELRTLRERSVQMALQLVQTRFPPDGPPFERVQVWADERTNTLIYRATAEHRAVISEMLDELDRPLPPQGEIAVIPLRYADPQAVAEQLQTLAAGAGGPAGATQAQQAGFSAIHGRELTVIADPATASLVVRARPAVLEIVQRVVALLDRRPRQVAVEILVQEWIYDAGMTLSFAGITAIGDVTKNGIVLQSIPGAVFETLPVPEVMAVQVSNLPSQIQMIADETAIEAITIMQPHLVLMSGEEQLLFSGNNVPVPTAPSTPESVIAGDSLVQTTVIQRYDVGVEILLRATVGEAQASHLEVTINIEQLRSSLAGDPAEVGPTFTQRGIETTVELLPGQALLIAGDTQGFRTRSRVGIPFLMDIPILGTLFSATQEENRRARIVIAAQAFALPDPAALAAYSVRRRLAFERARSRTTLLGDSSETRFTVRVARETSRERAIALAGRVETGAHPARVIQWDSADGAVFDVHLLDFAGYVDAAELAFELTALDLRAEVVPLATLNPEDWEAPPARAH